MTDLGTLFIISAPSGAGKTSLVRELIATDDLLEVSVSFTTRAPRQGERQGIDYHFCDEAEFTQRIQQAEFLEHAKVFDNYYGTSQVWVEERLGQGKDVILEIDWQGAKQIRYSMPEAMGIFILPPSIDVLRERLVERGQDDEGIIQQRLAKAADEISHYGEYDYLIINVNFAQALREMREIIQAQRLRSQRQQQVHANLIRGLLS